MRYVLVIDVADSLRANRLVSFHMAATAVRALALQMRRDLRQRHLATSQAIEHLRLLPVMCSVCAQTNLRSDTFLSGMRLDNFA